MVIYMIWHSSKQTDVLAEMNIDIEKGLSSDRADELLREYGENVLLDNSKSKNVSEAISKRTKHLPVALLIIAAIVLFVLEFTSPDPNLSIPIFVVVLLAINGIFSMYKELRSKSIIDSFAKKTNSTCRVIRDGKEKPLYSSLLVPGDIIYLESGDFIPADARIIKSINLHCDEAALNGDTVPKEKDADAILENHCPVGDRINMLYNGCSVISGQCIALVTETGINTEIGKLSKLENDTNEYSAVSQKLSEILRKISIASFIVCAIVFFIGILLHFRDDKYIFTDLVIDCFMTACALGIATIPEGLPSILSLCFAFGLKRMSKEKAIVKNTAAVATLAKVSVLCSDKTGTITLNRMNVATVYNGDAVVKPDYINGIDAKTANILRLAAMCCDNIDDNSDPTQRAITDACQKYLKLPKIDLDAQFPRIACVPFDADRKLMSTVNLIDGQNYCIVRGAPETLLPLCDNCNSDEIKKFNEELSVQGLRVIGLAVKQVANVSSNPTSDELECNLTFAGLIGLNDKLRQNITDSVSECVNCGIRPIMITGDNILTATAIAERLGILKGGFEAIDGEQLSALTDYELEQKVENISVYARVSTEDKLRIVRAWQSRGVTVAVTGDSAEDTHALMSADVGLSMGANGTDVARGASDIVLNNDSFSSIVSAAKESRSIFVNLKKSAKFLLGCNLGVALLTLLGLFIFGAFPITTGGLILLNIIVFVALSVAICLDKPDKSATENIDGKKIFDRPQILETISNGIITAISAIVAYGIFSSKDYAGAAAFATLSFGFIFSSFTVRTARSLLNIGYIKSINLYPVSIVSFVLTILFVTTPLSSLVAMNGLTSGAFFTCLLISVISTVITVIAKHVIKVTNHDDLTD